MAIFIHQILGCYTKNLLSGILPVWPVLPIPSLVTFMAWPLLSYIALPPSLHCYLLAMFSPGSSTQSAPYLTSSPSCDWCWCALLLPLACCSTLYCPSGTLNQLGHNCDLKSNVSPVSPCIWFLYNIYCFSFFWKQLSIHGVHSLLVHSHYLISFSCGYGCTPFLLVRCTLPFLTVRLFSSLPHPLTQACHRSVLKILKILKFGKWHILPNFQVSSDSYSTWLKKNNNIQ